MQYKLISGVFNCNTKCNQWVFIHCFFVNFLIYRYCSTPDLGYALYFPVPCTLRLIFHAVLQILQYMGQASLMAASIMVECPVMVVDEDPHGNFPAESSLPLHIFSSAGKIHRILFRGGTDKDLGIFLIFFCTGTVCMHDRRLEEPLE